ncbi:MAG: KpsF/GutQ family sugar-phosphate isomerase [Gammaproteobacteria bacterium]|nr:KpsF/GutQ family sugar-phosphate isomerase [Gammaproteobacteria bacterium]
MVRNSKSSSTQPGTATDEQLVELGRAVIATEARAVSALAGRIDAAFTAAARAMLACRGRIVVLGMGKSGHVGGKIAATLASTGTPAFFVHPGEASHGDMGMITAHDVVLALSNSGETDELVVLLPLIKRLGVALIALTGRPGSTLAQAATVNIDVGVAEEACPLGLAPTASTTAALAMGDALAVALLKARGFSIEDFALSHPGGRLGRRLLIKLSDLLHRGAEMPTVTEDTLLRDALVEMTRKGLGMTAILAPDGVLAGIFTDGDLRRALDRGVDVHAVRMREVMTRECKTVADDILAAEALQVMERHRINALLVVDRDRRLQGVVNMHDMLRARVL